MFKIVILTVHYRCKLVNLPPPPPHTHTQGSTFPGAQGHMPLDFAVDYGPKIVCIITRNPVYDH